MKILVVDDIAQNRIILEKLLVRSGHQIFMGEDGQQAVELYDQENPDMILIDIMMPVMNGLEAIKLIRSRSNDKWIPIIVLSALSSETDIIEGLKAGADDYMPKPINHAILNAKIVSIQRTIDMQNRILNIGEELKDYVDKYEQEQFFAEGIFNRIINQKDLLDHNLQYWLSPAERFSGDLIAVKRSGKDRLYFMLADSTGHGLSAALPTIIVNQVFQGMAHRAFLVSSIVKEINRRLKDELPPGRFVALMLGMIDSNNKLLEVWNGGIPESWVIDNQGEILKQFNSSHAAAGILDDQDFDDRTEMFHWQEPCELFLYSDGITDVNGKNNEIYGTERVLKVLKESSMGNRLNSVKASILEFMDESKVNSC